MSSLCRGVSVSFNGRISILSLLETSGKVIKLFCAPHGRNCGSTQKVSASLLNTLSAHIILDFILNNRVDLDRGVILSREETLPNS